MPSTPILIGLTALLLCIPAIAEDSNPIVHLDTTNGNPGKYEIIYVTIIEAKKSPEKTVAVILSQAEEQDLVYAYQVSGKSVTLELLPEATFTVPRADNANFSMTTVNVTEAQYNKSKKIIRTHIEMADETDSPEVRFYNCICEVLKACTMKIPYRSPYRSPNLTQWIGDIPAYSRDIVLQDRFPSK